MHIKYQKYPQFHNTSSIHNPRAFPVITHSTSSSSSSLAQILSKETEQRERMETSTRVEDVTGIGADVIRKASSAAMKAQRSPEKPYLCEKTKGTVFFAFPGSFSASDWFFPNNRKSFGETTTNRNQFPCLRSIGNDVDALVNEAFLRKSEAVSTHRAFQEEVEKSVKKRKQIIFTGHSSGGAIASMITIWFLQKYQITDPIRPRCVTFGSPLVGDQTFGHAIRRENWSHYFVHFIMKYDLIPRLMLVPKQQNLPKLLFLLNQTSSVPSHEAVQEALGFYDTMMRYTSIAASYEACKLMGNANALTETVSSFIQMSPYRPFGTYVFCTGDGVLVGVNNMDAVLQILFYSLQLEEEEDKPRIAFSCVTNHKRYENELQGLLATTLLDQLDRIPLSLDETEPSLSSVNATLSNLGLSTRGRLCVRAAGEAEKQRAENQKKLEGRKGEILQKLTWIENDYKRYCKAHKMGTYDSFKASRNDTDFLANVRRAELAGIWDEIIEMLRRNELPDRFEAEPDWIELGTRNRRLVEPLDIANYYRHLKNEDTGPYMGSAIAMPRPKRYSFAQRWLEHAQRIDPDKAFRNVVEEVSGNQMMGLPKFTGTRCESCLWAEVEELSGKPYEEIRVRVLVLEKMVEKWIEKQELVKEDVFLDESAFVKWWKMLPAQHRVGSRIAELMNNS